jgi:hypothetical protein
MKQQLMVKAIIKLLEATYWLPLLPQTFRESELLEGDTEHRSAAYFWTYVSIRASD